jgi:hypothetical protein
MDSGCRFGARQKGFDGPDESQLGMGYFYRCASRQRLPFRNQHAAGGARGSLEQGPVSFGKRQVPGASVLEGRHTLEFMLSVALPFATQNSCKLFDFHNLCLPSNHYREAL